LGGLSVKLSEDEAAIGFVAIVAIWSLIVLPFIYLQDGPLLRFWHWTTHDPVAFYTFVLATSTIGLWIVTWRSSVRQSRELRIIERAYLSAVPLGINPYLGSNQVVGHVGFYNAGNLPAQNVSWFVDHCTTLNGSLEHFPVDEIKFFGRNVIAAKASMTQGTYPIDLPLPSEGYLYVWGEVRYNDGFGNGRFTRFCLRYNLRTFGKLASGSSGIEATYARHHEFGNDSI
jgi:hypothetical protein